MSLHFTDEDIEEYGRGDAVVERGYMGQGTRQTQVLILLTSSCVTSDTLLISSFLFLKKNLFLKFERERGTSICYATYLAFSG